MKGRKRGAEGCVDQREGTQKTGKKRTTVEQLDVLLCSWLMEMYCMHYTVCKKYACVFLLCSVFVCICGFLCVFCVIVLN